MVSDARNGVPVAIGADGIRRYIASALSSLDDSRTDLEKWVTLREEAESIVRSVRGLEGYDEFDDGGDEERRQVVLDEIERTGGDPLLYQAVSRLVGNPVTEELEIETAPPATLADAAKVYERERIGDKPSKSARNTFNKIKRRLETSLGPLNKLALISLKREHAVMVRDDLLSTPKESGGGTLSPASVEREINSIKAMVTVGIREHNLRGKAFNPFEGLSLPASVPKSTNSEWEERDPLPDALLLAVRNRVMTHVRIPELRLIWRLLQATGCRGAEITGLRVGDVILALQL